MEHSGRFVMGEHDRFEPPIKGVNYSVGILCWSLTHKCSPQQMFSHRINFTSELLKKGNMKKVVLYCITFWLLVNFINHKTNKQRQKCSPIGPNQGQLDKKYFEQIQLQLRQ